MSQHEERLQEYYSRCAICNKKWDAHEPEAPAAFRLFMGVVTLGVSEIALGPEVHHKFVKRERPE